MSYQISDFDELQIYITDGWREWYVPKFRIYMVIDEPVCYLYWADTEKGSSGLTRMIPLDYNDVAFGYTYPSSASEVALVIEMYKISAWTNITPAASTIFDIVNVTGDDTLALTDAWKALVIDDAGGGVEITVPDNATVAFPIGTEIRLLCATAQDVDIIADTGVTINSLNGWLSLEDQFAEATLVKTATDEWYLYGDLRKTMDSDLSALLAASAVTLTEAQIGYLNDFYIGMKADNIYTKLTAMWFGFIGTTLDHKKYNGVDPQNTDAAFRQTYTGSPTPAANHIAYNGTTQYANTHIIPTTHLTENDTHVCIVTSNEYNAGIAIGADNPWPKRFALWPRQAGTRYSQFYDTASGVGAATASSIGRHIATRTANNVHKLFDNGVQFSTTNTTVTTNWAFATYKLYIGAAGGSAPSNYCACNVNYASVGAGLSDTDVANYDARLATLLTNFGL